MQLLALSQTQQVNNAGILVRQTWDKETYDNTLAVNTAGPVLLSQALLPLLAPGALIVNVSSSEQTSAPTALALRRQILMICDHNAGVIKLAGCVTIATAPFSV
jgi:NAD(P)-dependent dehydrogenase (short-subunit alcohol dehydrogenase family)